MHLSGYVPWRKISSWRCLACGICCSRFKVPLRSYEYARIFQIFGSEVIRLHHSGKPYLKKSNGSCVFQDTSGLCLLQPLGLKPVACKLWPFAVRQRKIEGKHNREAAFHHKEKKYYVYVKPSCPGINQGRPPQLTSTLHEIVEISLNPTKPQENTTSKHPEQRSIRPVVTTF